MQQKIPSASLGGEKSTYRYQVQGKPPPTRVPLQSLPDSPAATTPQMDKEIARLRSLLEEEQRLRKEEQRRRNEAEKATEEEQRLRKEEQRLRKEEQRRRNEAEKATEEEQRLRKEEQRRRDEAEKRAETSQPLSLRQYLEACHSLSLAIQVVTDRSLTTQGDTTNPTGRIYPRRIIPWHDYPTQQENIWDRLLVDKPFCSDARETVEKAVQKLVNKVHSNEQLRTRLGVQGPVTFESHTNFRNTVDAVPEQMTIAENVGTAATTPAPKPKARRKAGRGKMGPADQVCIYRRFDGQNVPALAIEYKAPHKLTRDEVITGLREEIQPERDVINKDDEGFASASRRLTTAVITQLFSYMVNKGIQYGYVCTGETFIFLHIPDDPSVVYYSVCVPNLDVLEDDENRLHCTAVAQVFAFVLQALRSPPPPLAWHDRAEGISL
ncbi:hypothetical protein NUW58_g9502 [Xylaria curta]|uniref:Uncharacterized protein n=1 Tax=Xylaria curta TaxID=42375 RepID=A0ACC1MVU2_9PEZI|nr:hypothetical protein NUW58_g9502 [Xylaria curta]